MRGIQPRLDSPSKPKLVRHLSGDPDLHLTLLQKIGQVFGLRISTERLCRFFLEIKLPIDLARPKSGSGFHTPTPYSWRVFATHTDPTLNARYEIHIPASCITYTTALSTSKDINISWVYLSPASKSQSLPCACLLPVINEMTDFCETKKKVTLPRYRSN